MSHAEALQFIGTIFIAFAGVLALYVVVSVKQWCLYGRWITAVLAGSQFVFVGDRLLYMAGVIGAETTIIASGMIAAVLVTVELNLIVMHVKWHKIMGADAHKVWRNNEHVRNVGQSS